MGIGKANSQWCWFIRKQKTKKTVKKKKEGIIKKKQKKDCFIFFACGANEEKTSHEANIKVSAVGYVTIVIHTVPRNHRNTSQNPSILLR